jgi:hypothetical protein
MTGTRGVAIGCAGLAILLAGACADSGHVKTAATPTFDTSGPKVRPPPLMLEPSSPPILPARPDIATRFGGLVGQWQSARTMLLRDTGGSIAAERQQAVTFVTAERRFAMALDPAHWPDRAAGPLHVLRAASGSAQRTLEAMTTAAGTAEFATLLAAYRTDATAENRAIRTVRQALT